MIRWKLTAASRDVSIFCATYQWALSVRGLYVYELPKEYRDLTSSTPAYLENCPKAATPVIPAYLRFPRPAPEPKGSL